MAYLKSAHRQNFTNLSGKTNYFPIIGVVCKGKQVPPHTSCVLLCRWL